MSKNKYTSLDPHFQSFIQKCIEEGKFRNSKEVVEAGLSLLSRKMKISSLKEAIEQGIESQSIKDFDPDKYLAQLKRKHC